MKVSDIRTDGIYRVNGVCGPVRAVEVYAGEDDTPEKVRWQKVAWDYEEGRWCTLFGYRCAGTRCARTFARAAKVIGSWPDQREEAA